MQLIATNGKQFPAVMVFAHSLNYFKHMCLQELRGQMVSDSVTAEDVQWVITVPAIWRESAKQFMRKAAVEVRLTTSLCACMTCRIGIHNLIMLITTLISADVHHFLKCISLVVTK